MECVFCRIAQRREAAEIVYEDDELIAFLALAPLAEGHALLATKRHFSSIVAVPAPLQGRMMTTGARLAVALAKVTEADGFNLLLANGVCAGQTVRHAHLHVVPRFSLDGLPLPPSGGEPPSSRRWREIAAAAHRRLIDET